MPRRTARLLPLLVVLTSLLLPAQAALAFKDVPSGYWDYAAIQYSATQHDWMADFSNGTFHPRVAQHREWLARALVRAYAPGQSVDPNIHFPDLPNDDPYFAFANVAVHNGGLEGGPGGAFRPDDSVRTSTFDRSLVLAMGLDQAAAGLAHIHEATDGYTYTVPAMVPYLELAHVLGLHYNHPSGSETMELEPSGWITRDEVAYSLWKAKTMSEWQRAEADRFIDIAVPNHANPDDPTQAQRRTVTAFAIRSIGYPYIYGGEWNAASPGGYCCGYQVKGGFDCSGFTWWLLKKAGEGGYDNGSFRGYAGWSLPQRTSYDMAHATPSKIAFAYLRTGDMMLFADGGGGTWSDADHVGVYLGNGWMVHSTGSNAGVAIEWAGSGWWRDHFLWGRRLF
jgi:cell wall-associated NlpC family hydrolase